MATAVITGGTAGIGRALAETYLCRGYDVLAIGSSPRNGRDFLGYAKDAGAGDRAHFLAADLSEVAGTERLAATIAGRFPVVDVLVLAARYHRSTRLVTPEGFESNFALFYLSRFLLSHGLVGPLSRAGRPVVLNFGGAGQAGPVRWDDLQLERDYSGTGAMAHAATLNDLLGLSFVDLHRETGIRYLLNHPGVVATTFAGEYDPVTAARVEYLKVIGKSAEQSVSQILPYLDRPTTARLTAVHEGIQVPLEPRPFTRHEAARLHEATTKLLAEARC
ncbi:SDR family NAD(P)-dependent oxidoreductase [Streptomyces sp. NBC_01198]|uniref:SDR family NAD(P)-dependent oxidoreductase n=1 Tax=Streptomyces sp. NBC_01198 TaxID=2903769 RepID=UPI002E12D1A0|nr:SDR family NAD(P)-dependent oxidoreductase [Streptomyces sp. NBC_01198]